MALDKETISSVLSSVPLFKNIQQNTERLDQVSRIVSRNVNRVENVLNNIDNRTFNRNDDEISSALKSGLDRVTRVIEDKDQQNQSTFSRITQGVSFVRDTLDQVNEEVWAVKKIAYRNQNTLGIIQSTVENLNSNLRRREYQDIENKREMDFQINTLQQENIRQRNELDQHKQAIADLVSALQTTASQGTDQTTGSMIGSFLVYQLSKFLLRNPWVIGAGAALLGVGALATLVDPSRIPEDQRADNIRKKERENLQNDIGIDPTTGGSSPSPHPGRAGTPEHRAALERQRRGREAAARREVAPGIIKETTGGFGPGGAGGIAGSDVATKIDKAARQRMEEKWPGSSGTTVSGNIPNEAKALLDTISGPGLEGANYNTIVGGGKFDDFSKHPNKVGIVTRNGPSTAAGRYQIVGSTWRNLQKQYPGEFEDFTPATQDKAAWYLARDRYKRETKRDLAEDLKSKDPKVIQRIGKVLSGEWTSLPGGIEQGSAAGQFVDRFMQNRDSAQQLAESGKGDLKEDATVEQTRREAAGDVVFPVTGDLAEGRTSEFGYARGRLHAGVDIYAKDPETGQLRVGKKAEVFAAASGKIVASRKSKGYGWIVDVEDENGVVHRYAHVSKPYGPDGKELKTGDVVEKGQKITHITGAGTDFGRYADKYFDGDVEAAAASLDKKGWGGMNKPHLHYETRNQRNAFGKTGAMDPKNILGPLATKANKDKLMLAGYSPEEIDNMSEDQKMSLLKGDYIKQEDVQTVSAEHGVEALQKANHPLAPKQKQPQQYTVSKDLYDAAQRAPGFFNATEKLNKGLSENISELGGKYDPSTRTITGLNAKQIEAVNAGIAKQIQNLPVPSSMIPDNLKNRTSFTTPVPMVRDISNQQSQVRNSHESTPNLDQYYRGVHIPGENRTKLKRYSETAKKGNESNAKITPNDEAHQEVAFYYNEYGVPVI